jgi:hypothetical protein
MDVEQFAIVKKLLEEIRDLLKEQQSNQQPQTKITVVGNKPQTKIPKGMNSNDDFSF